MRGTLTFLHPYPLQCDFDVLSLWISFILQEYETALVSWFKEKRKYIFHFLM